MRRRGNGTCVGADACTPLAPLGGELLIVHAAWPTRLTVWLLAPVRSDWRGWRRIPSPDASGCRGKRSRTTARGGTTRRPSNVERPTHFSICAEEQQWISSAEIEAPHWIPDTGGRATAAAMPLGARRWRSGGLPGAYCTMSRLCPNPDHGPYNRARDRQRSGDLRPLLLHTPNKSRRNNDHLAVIRLIVRRHPANLTDGDGDRRVARGAHLALDRSHLRAKQSEAHRASGIGQSYPDRAAGGRRRQRRRRVRRASRNENRNTCECGCDLYPARHGWPVPSETAFNGSFGFLEPLKPCPAGGMLVFVKRSFAS